MGIVEKIYPYVLGLFAPLAIMYYKLTPSCFEHYKEIMSSTISLGSIAIGFLAAAITLMPSLSDNKFVVYLKQIGAYRKLLQYLIEAIIFLFFTSLLSILGLFINISIQHVWLTIFFVIWGYVFLVGILLSIRVIYSFLKILVYANE